MAKPNALAIIGLDVYLYALSAASLEVNPFSL
jgi:hypothetical protein